MLWYRDASMEWVRVSPDSITESRTRRAEHVLAAALLLMAVQAAAWWSGLGGRDLHRALGLAGVGVLAAGLSMTRREARLPRPSLARLLDGNALFAVLSAAYFVAWLLNQGIRYYRFEFANFDLGIYSNVAFNTAHGHPFHSSILAHSHLGEHFSPILALFAPLYALKPTVYWLLGAQCLSFAAVPLVLAYACRAMLPDRTRANAIALLLALLWGIYPPMAAAMRFPFHPSSLAAPWVILAFCFVHRRQWSRAIPILLLLLAFKESLTLVWVGLGLHLLVSGRDRRVGLCLVVAGLLAAVLILKGVIPAFREGDWGQASRLDPDADLKLKAWYVVRLLIPLLGLPLLSWRNGIVALPSILLNLSTGYEPQYSSRFQYDDVIAPLLFAASIPAADQAWQILGRWRTPHRAAFALASVYACAVWQLPASPLRDARDRPPTAEHRALNAELGRLAADYPDTWIYVQSHLGPHLHRHELRQFPIRSRDCGQENFRQGTLVVLSTQVNPWGFVEVADCIRELQARPRRFQRLPDYEMLAAFYVWQGP